jgi:hypothetical protein
MIPDYRDISICGVPYRLIIVGGGAIFSNKCGFYGVTNRFMFEFKEHLWYLIEMQVTFNRVPACHLSKMHEKLGEFIGRDHEEFELVFKK